MTESQIDLTGAKILLVDDTPENIKVLRQTLEAEGYSILVAVNGETAIEIAQKAHPDLILLDVLMPGIDGFETCRRLKQDETTQDIPVIFVTARAETEAVVEGFHAGGVDYIVKPFQSEEVLIRVQTHLKVDRLNRELIGKNDELSRTNQQLQEEIAQRKALKGQLTMISQREADRWGLEGFVGESPTIKKIFKDIRLMQENIATSVLITGESGTGKELIARAIHFGSTQDDAPFVPVNCNAIPSELVESVLFGHVRGAFTGANEDRTGYFEMAHGGTLFLDEIGDMKQELQGKLLRVLEDGEVWRVGGKEGKKVEVRVIAATNSNLQQKIQDSAFRQDLYFRLARYTVTAPPLRDRKEDIPLLAYHFLKLFAEEMGRDAPTLNPEAIRTLADYSFPGNVRELKNVIERALIESGGAEIEPRHLYFVSVGEPGTASASSVSAGMPGLPMDLDEAARQAEQWVVEQAMEQVDGNLSEAARLLGTSRNKIYRIMNDRKKE